MCLDILHTVHWVRRPDKGTFISDTNNRVNILLQVWSLLEFQIRLSLLKLNILFISYFYLPPCFIYLWYFSTFIFSLGGVHKLRLQDLSFFDHLTHDINIDTCNTFKKWQYSQEMFFLLICKTVENAKAQNSRKLFSI